MSPELALALRRSSTVLHEFTEVNFVRDPPLHNAVWKRDEWIVVSEFGVTPMELLMAAREEIPRRVSRS